VDPRLQSPDWMQITPKAGSLFQATSHSTKAAQSSPLSTIAILPPESEDVDFSTKVTVTYFFTRSPWSTGLFWWSEDAYRSPMRTGRDDGSDQGPGASGRDDRWLA
jgi:hypothetical protein